MRSEEVIAVDTGATSPDSSSSFGSDGFPGWLFRKTGARYVDAMASIMVLWIHLVMIPTYTVLLIPYFDASGDQVVRIIVAFEISFALAAPGIIVIARRHLGTAMRWVSGNRSVSVESAWHSLIEGPSRAVAYCGLWLAAWSVPPASYAADVVGLSPVGTTLYLVALIVLVAGATGFAYLMVDQFKRPPLRQVVAALPDSFAGSHAGVSLATRIQVFVPLMTLYTGTIIAMVSTNSLGLEGNLAVTLGAALAVSATVSTGFALLLRQAALQRLDGLRGAIRQLEAGDYEVRVPPLGGDELDEVGQSFNQMVGRLGENEHALRESRARIVAASDAERKRVERNLHDGAQQHLVGLALQLRLLEEQAADRPELKAGLESAGAELSEALAELRELARGLHPQALRVGGLKPALSQLRDRSAIPVELEATDERFSDAVESTAYFVAAEALANVAKYAQASAAEVRAEWLDGNLVLSVADNGIGGADVGAGTGLAGLADRVAALEGRLEVESPDGTGTKVTVTLPALARDSDDKG